MPETLSASQSTTFTCCINNTSYNPFHIEFLSCFILNTGTVDITCFKSHTWATFGIHFNRKVSSISLTLLGHIIPQPVTQHINRPQPPGCSFSRILEEQTMCRFFTFPKGSCRDTSLCYTLQQSDVINDISKASGTVSRELLISTWAYEVTTLLNGWSSKPTPKTRVLGKCV